jgi:hypothetical protein
VASKKKNGKETVSFIAHTLMPQKRRVSFISSTGKRVTFKATKMVPKKERITFRARRK